MKRVLSISFSALLAVALLTSCDQIKNLIGNKAAEQQKKMDEMAAQVAQKLAEQQKAQEEAKAQMEAQVEAEVQKRLAEEKAKAETQPETQAQTQPATQPTAALTQADLDKAAAAAVAKEEKKEEKKDATAEKKKEKEQTNQKLQAMAEKLSGYARVYVDKGLRGNVLTLSFGHNVVSTNNTPFKDNCSSVSYNVPAGWVFVMYADSGFAGARMAVHGTGSIGDVGYMNDKCSSFRWEKQ